ncbi:MAG: manganese efflux pump [Alphaproteobacteria bacterium]|nr:manganese efflux pump [Alphaproteobacteria bacterium]
MIELLLLAFALAIDAAAVSATLAVGATPKRTVGAATVVFGVFQGGMAWLGALGGDWLAARAATWDHWVAFALLAIVGGRMALGGAEIDDPDGPDDTLTIPALFGLAVATSIDALASGVTLPLIGPPVLASVIVIGVVTTGLSGLAAGVAGRVSDRFAGAAERIGGLVLIAIGLRILVTHLMGWA